LKKVILGSLLCLILVEGVLQVLAKKMNPYGSYPEFFEVAVKRIKDSDPVHTIFFVGDSTVFGGGASDEKLFSLPAQFQKLLERAGSPFNVQNLGYPGTTGKEHLEILRLLPDQAKVIMRTGINDSWKRHESYKIRIFGQYFELRLLKLSMILWYGWHRDAKSESATSAYYDELTLLAKQKELDLSFVDYFLGEKTFMNSYFKDFEDFIPLAEILKDAGFFDPGGYVSRRFLSFDLVHANDLGYRLQAQAVFNWLARRSKFGLVPESALELAVDEKALNQLRANLDLWLSRLRKAGLDGADLFPFVMKAAWQVYVATGEKGAYERYLGLGKLYTYAFLSIYPITYALNRQDTMSTTGHYQNSRTLSVKEINDLFQVIRVLKDRSTHDYVSEYQEKFSEFVNMDRKISDYSALNPPFPLELCKKFLHETGLSQKKIGVLDQWERVFGTAFNREDIARENWEVCRIE
jgi:lysophospholipase L1-like esterase